jgi:hypothetical protein
MSWDATPPAAFESEGAWAQWADGLGVEWPGQEGEQMGAAQVVTRESRRGGWDAVAVVNGLTFEGHGGTAAEAVADLREQLVAFEALQTEVSQ